ncbi:LysE family translocator [Marinomonas posidonica]|uniref:Lysine exporter protein (LYSE/YGGA) n=1 Tax=Marinomonas posidonica (strain CECT 7376 / NCIMB 14433 / IVIA-Po-181) TaxID=491952 RepID=F6CTU3_MARPP|nr:LysE family translocator [Marinomonas posidonica]AEF56312.1 Lysine exporter protein (LYSE/YGGA) [Marinomonas posidonica IVIA-Po-181]
MLDFHTWVVFLSASLALAFAPGPGMLYVLSRTISGGRSVGVASTLGAASGGVVHVFAAALGMSAILATSAVAFTVVKYLGAIFLVYLGVKMILSAFKKVDLSTVKRETEKKGEIKSAFYQGVISEILNPKTAIFFLAFIPQFIHPEKGDLFLQFFVLGMVVVLFNSLPDFLISFFSKPVEHLWNTSATFRKVQQATSGLCLVGLGIYLALSGSNKGIQLKNA